MNPQTWWYVVRASGIVAWLLRAASMLWGIVLAARPKVQGLRPAWLLDLHRWLGGLSLTFVGIHLAALVADSFVPIDVIDLLVPFAIDAQPAAVALGMLALRLLLAVEVTSLLMRRLPKPRWRGVHLTSYLLFWLATLHGILAGTDASHPMYVGAVIAVVGLVVPATVYRLLTSGRRTGRRRPAQAREPIKAGR